MSICDVNGYNLRIMMRARVCLSWHASITIVFVFQRRRHTYAANFIASFIKTCIDTPFVSLGLCGSTENAYIGLDKFPKCSELGIPRRVICTQIV